MHTLYICYFGLREPLVQTQVLPYLRELKKAGIQISLLTFEPGWPHSWSMQERGNWKTALLEQGIKWRALRYHKRPSVPATLYDIIIGAAAAAWWSHREKIEIFHARAHIAMAMSLIARWLVRARTVFDLRGLVAEEYVDAGLWSESSLIFRAFKKFENHAASHTDQIIVLTNRMKAFLIEKGLVQEDQIEVIPCCVDLSRFADKSLGKLSPEGRPDRFTMIYAGSVTGLYLLEEIGRFFLLLRAKRPEAYLRILTSSNQAWANTTLLRLGMDRHDFEVISVAAEEVPQFLERADVGISFRKATISQLAASPTKIPEYLAAGIPVISNAGIGDTDEILLSDNVGIVINRCGSADYRQAVEELEQLLRDPTLSARCRASAKRHFDLINIGGSRYYQVYERMKIGFERRHLIENESNDLTESTDIQFYKER